MRFANEEDYQAFLAALPANRNSQKPPNLPPESGERGKAKATGAAKKKVGPQGQKRGKWQGENLRLILPFKMPTWNQLLAMNHFQRAKVRKWIHAQVSTCIQSGDALQTPMGLVLRLQLMPSCLEEYSRMITPNTSRKSHTAKKLARKKKR